MTSLRIAILHAPGTNRDHDAALAFEQAGGRPEIVHVRQILAGDRGLSDFAMLVIPGGFSYGDDLGAGKLWAVRLLHDLGDPIGAFVEAGKPVLGICNGFQVLVKMGLLPGPLHSNQTGGRSAKEQDAATISPHSAVRNRQSATLGQNASAHFECRWVYIEPNTANRSPWLDGLDRIFCPIAHGEGNFMVQDSVALQELQAQGLVAFTYVDAQGHVAGYPSNPNGSAASIAGITNPSGNILGLMPHPENHILPWQHPGYHGGAFGQTGRQLFANGVRLARAG